MIHSHTDKPFFSIVVPTYERPEDLRKCLESLEYKKQLSLKKYEIIVTDDSKSENSKELVKKEFPRVKWGKGKQNGPGGNRNAGVDRANGDWIVFIDDDCIADKDYLNAYLRAISDNHDITLFEGLIYPDRPRMTWAECCPENSNGGMFWTSNLCVKKTLFKEIGGFDELFKVAYEDIDFAYRIRSQGYKTKFVEEASVCHPWRTLKHEGNNWKPKGFEVSELLLFIKKHPNAYEHSSPQVYWRHLLRMLTTDLKKCLIEFKGAGIMVLISQSLTTLMVIMALTYNKFRSN
jgi:GT2 family glycosyltransferase